jgi:hypothetical protein
MSSVGINSLFNTMPDDQYKLHLFSSQPTFSQAMLKMSFSAVIFLSLQSEPIAELGWPI